MYGSTKEDNIFTSVFGSVQRDGGGGVGYVMSISSPGSFLGRFLSGEGAHPI